MEEPFSSFLSEQETPSSSLVPQVVVDTILQEDLDQYSFHPRETIVRRIIREYQNEEYLVELEADYRLRIALPQLYKFENACRAIKIWGTQKENLPQLVESDSDGLGEDLIVPSNSVNTERGISGTPQPVNLQSRALFKPKSLVSSRNTLQAVKGDNGSPESRSRSSRDSETDTTQIEEISPEIDLPESNIVIHPENIKKRSLLAMRNGTRKTRSSGLSNLQSLSYDVLEESSTDSDSDRPKHKKHKNEPERRSARNTRVISYTHSGTPTELYSDNEPSSNGQTHIQSSKRQDPKKKQVGQFGLLDQNSQDDFSVRHSGYCDKCDKAGDVVPCQSCSLCLHETCLAQTRNQIIKLNDSDNQLRCFRCIGKARNDQSINVCTKCDKVQVFNGDNAVSQVFFRCYFCYQTLCWSHAPDNLSQWKCPDCILHLDHKVDSVLGRNAFDRYLVKFQDVSFIKTEWIRGTWLAGISPRKKDNFDNKYQRIIKEKSEVVKEEWCNIEICLDVEFMEAKSRAVMCFSGEEELKRSIDQVERVYVKWLERPYVDVCWEKPPSRDQPERYENYKKAYFEWARGCYVELPRQKASKPKGKFEDIEFKEQQAYLVGGKLMDYQMEGMNWLYYQWARNHPAILADEMGLGKTIQIISLLATLYHEHRTWPFLVVAPNSTVPNWKREVEKWAPSMRVVALTGLESTKKLIKNYELLTQPKGLKAHVIITSYQSAMSEIATLKAFPWEVLIVDEGQRLKCDSSNLYRDLMTLKVGQKFLLTGTPLQNNIRELLNLLQFLKPDLNASSLEAKYNSNEPLSAEQITELHVLLKPFFLRRTKADVLTFLPSKSEVIVPVSMVSVQKRLYKSILEKNADLIRAIMSSGTGEKTKHKGSLNNIMIQLRKCLCHPYVYSQEIEEKTSDKDLERRNLIGASGKLELLNILLPKLKEKGHRVLIFSQFLNMLDILEDFLNILDMPFARIDGSTSSDDRQQAIDEYNRPDSTLFVFLLSTRAGGVGINLATADTIIIYDPDFNPHQDMQALARAHRIGQMNKVLVLKLVTKGTVEEKIIRIGNKKLVLDHLIIERLDVDEPESLDIANVLQFGARALFEGNDDTVVKYDDAAIDSLLDRNVLEEVSSHQQPKNANSFAFARIWANENAGELEEQRGEDGNADNEPDLALWDSILKKREEDAQKQRDREEAAFAKGRRKNAKIDYKTYYEDSPQKDKGKQSHNDDDFLVSAAECESESGDNIDLEELFNPHDLAKEIADVPSIRKDIRTSVHDSSTAIYNVAKVSDPSVTKLPGGAKVEISATNMPDAELHLEDIWYAKSFRNKQAVLLKPSKFISNGKRKCIACGKSDHFPGKCPLREILAEQCNICTGFHWTGSRQCPALNHSFIVKRIKNELNDIKEPKEQVLAARKVLAKIYAMFRSKEAVSIKHSKKGQEGIASGISASMD